MVKLATEISGEEEEVERVKSGYGEISYVDDRQYLGEWRENRMNGFGFLKNADGSYYQGRFLNGFPHGYGI